MTDLIYNKIRKRIVAKRKDLKLSQEKLAELVDLHYNYVGKIERGEKRPTLITLYKIAKALDMKLEDLFRGL